MKEIFSTWGQVKRVDVSMDRVVNLPRGYAYVEFERREDAEKALAYMDGGQIDGNIIQYVVTTCIRLGGSLLSSWCTHMQGS